MTQEEIRLAESGAKKKHWKRWGPYLSERAWGTVREDYSAYGNAWEYLPHDHARSRAYRWNEDGLAGICEPEAIHLLRACPMERTRSYPQGTHLRPYRQRRQSREDVKEYYFYLDSTPTHSYMKHLYSILRAEFPYGQLVDENRRRGKNRESLSCSIPECSTTTATSMCLWNMPRLTSKTS